jgi:phosphoribosylglycinamide formyltransferase-1
MENEIIHIALFASGTGSNAGKIIEYFHLHPFIKVALVVSNNPDAPVLKISSGAGIGTLIISRERFFKGDAYLDVFHEKKIDFIVLAGFLWKVPLTLIRAYPGKIINIHPALLPKFGGKGMYGKHVHEAVLAAGEKISGITIHYVDEQYDHGKIIFQASCPVTKEDDANTLAEKIHQLEYHHFPPVIEKTIKNIVKTTGTHS